MEIGLRGTVEWRIWLLVSLLAGGARAEVDYRRDVKPILQTRCVSCHGPRRQQGGLRLDTAAALRRGGNEGPALIAGQAAVSLIVLRVTDPDPDARMPQEAKPLLPREIRILRSWIDSGATAPADEVPVEETDHWAFQSVSRPALEGPFAPTSDNPIDTWIDAEHRRRGLSTVPLADPPTVLRRVSLDLVGLAPRRDRLHRFTDDTAPDAYQRLVDELLASPRYAERWGRHWMDVWRYSDRFGVLGQRSQDHIWQWRDWILDALNADQGYDQMIASMLAADELTPTDRGALRATGFVARNYFHFNRDVWLDATVEHTAKAFLALTLNCCRCHDHKFDPLGQRDYYAFRAIFEPHRVRIDRFPGGPDVPITGIPRIFDADPGAPTWLYQGGDAKRPDTERAVTAGPPGFLDFAEYAATPVDLPQASYYPALDSHATAEMVAAARGAVACAETARADGDDPVGRQRLASARAELASLQARIAAERARHAQPRSIESGQLSQAAAVAEGIAVRASAELDVLLAETEFAASLDVSGEAARGRVLAAETQLTEAWDRLEALPEDSREATGYSHLGRIYSAVSSGRRGALAAWITHPRNPLTARVAVNHVWLRHFGEPLVSTVFDFGRNGSHPSHPKLLDWLASAFVEHEWSMKWAAPSDGQLAGLPTELFEQVGGGGDAGCGPFESLVVAG